MKSVRQTMDIIAAYREVGSYRGAAAMCNTTHRTVYGGDFVNTTRSQWDPKH